MVHPKRNRVGRGALPLREVFATWRSVTLHRAALEGLKHDGDLLNEHTADPGTKYY